MSNSKGFTPIVFAFLGSLLLLFVIAPLAGLVLSTGTSGLIEAAEDIEVRQSIGRTLFIAMLTTFFFSLLVVPFAWIMARRTFPFRRLLHAIINIPVVIPHSAAGIALLGIVSRNTALGRLAETAGISFVNNPAGIFIAMAFVSMPYLFNAAVDGFGMVPEMYEKVARSMGAGPFRIFRTISLPLAGRSILSGMVMMWGRGMSEFGAVVIMAYHPMTTPVMIYERFTSFGLDYARPVTALFVVICLLVFVLLNMISRPGKNASAR
ncbi:MAG TPA: ABC transporter permease [Bacteroidales bacterium]|nr:ABC transporter permease [Bacteroidales bacterium]